MLDAALAVLLVASTPQELLDQSAALQRAGKYKEAQAPLLEVLAQVKDPSSPVRRDAQNNLGTAYRRNGEAAQAVAVLEPLLAVISGSAKADREEKRIVMNNLAMAYLHAGRAADAQRLWERALALVPKTGDDEEAARALDNLAGLHLAANDPARAAPYATRAAAVWLRLHGKDSLDYGVSQSVLGTVAMRQGRFDAGRGHLQTALAIHIKVNGEAHPDCTPLYNLLGELEFLAGRFPQAREALTRSMQISKALGRPVEHPEVQAAVAGMLLIDRSQ